MKRSKLWSKFLEFIGFQTQYGYFGPPQVNENLPYFMGRPWKENYFVIKSYFTDFVEWLGFSKKTPPETRPVFSVAPQHQGGGSSNCSFPSSFRVVGAELRTSSSVPLNPRRSPAVVSVKDAIAEGVDAKFDEHSKKWQARMDELYKQFEAHANELLAGLEQRVMTDVLAHLPELSQGMQGASGSPTETVASHLQEDHQPRIFSSGNK